MSPSSSRDTHARERVITADLASVLIMFREEWETERPKPGAKGRKMHQPLSETYMGAMSYMAESAGVSARRIWGIMNCEHLTTSFWLADRILVGIGMEHKLYDGSIREFPEDRLNEIRGGDLKSNGLRRTFSSMEEWLEYLDNIGCRR